MSHRWSRADSCVAAALCVIAFLFAEWYLPVFRAGGGVAQFYQDQFGPAVMVACGRGFVNADSPSVQRFDDFLHQRTPSLRCADVPESIAIEPVTPLQASAQYLLIGAGLLWRATGIDFHALDGLIAACFAVASVAAFVAVTLFCGRTLGLIVVGLWMFSYRHLENLPHLRDYSKAPFFMMMLAAMAIVAYDRPTRSLVAIGAVFGAVQGLGFGARTDVVLNFVAFFIALFAAAVYDKWPLRPRLLCAIASLGVFTIVALPILRSYASKSSLWHVVLLGLTAPYDENLNIGFPRPAYSFPYAHNDSYIETVVRAYWHRVHPTEPLLTMLTGRYDRACQDYFFRWAATFPGDVMTRGVAAIAGVVNLPFSLPDGRIPIGIVNPWFRNFWQIRGYLAQSLNGAGLVLLIGALIVLAMRARWLACIACVLVAFWGAFPAIEFQGRHIFHLELVVIGMAVWTGAAVFRQVGAVEGRGSRIGERMMAPVLRAAATVVMLIAIVVIAVAIARAYQIANVRRLVAAYSRVPATSIEPMQIPLADGTVRLAVDLFRPTVERQHVDEVLLKAEFDFARCGHPAAVESRFSYDISDPFLAAFAHAAPLEDLGEPATGVFLPVYSVVRDWRVVAQFAGVDVPASFARCVRLSRVDDTSSLALVIPLTIAPDWSRKLYQRVRLDSGLGY